MQPIAFVCFSHSISHTANTHLSNSTYINLIQHFVGHTAIEHKFYAPARENAHKTRQ